MRPAGVLVDALTVSKHAMRTRLYCNESHNFVCCGIFNVE